MKKTEFTLKNLRQDIISCMEVNSTKKFEYSFANMKGHEIVLKSGFSFRIYKNTKYGFLGCQVGTEMCGTTDERILNEVAVLDDMFKMYGVLA